MIGGWLRFFRVVNLPTVPGDVLAGAAAALAGGCAAGAGTSASLAAAGTAAVFLYLFGLADNDIVGAPTDRDRPIPAGEISLGAARLARGLCLLGVLVAGSWANLPPVWWIAAFALAVTCVAYNRTKRTALMGLCRGLNVVCGAAILFRGAADAASPLPWTLAAVWTLYIAVVTKCSEGEETDPERKRFVGFLIGALVYLQLLALLILYLVHPTALMRNLLLTGAALLIVLRLMKRLLPKVSAS